MGWTIDQMPSMEGKTAVVTGANSGIGLGAAKGLAAAGAKVILACRSEQRAQQAIETIQQQTADADLSFVPLDLASLASVRVFADHIMESHDECHLLINNAGLMTPPYQLTEDGFEMQIGVNFLGHYLLTGLMLPMLEKSANARVVTIASLAHVGAKLFHDNFNGETSYSRWPFYKQSKLACLLFALELQRRLEATGSEVQSLSAHPGLTATDLLDHIPLAKQLMPLLLQSADQGAQPTLQAACDPAAKGGEYYGPQGFREFRGPSGKARITRSARSAEESKWLWDKAAELTGFSYL